MKDGNKQQARKFLEKTFENVKRVQLQKYHKSNSQDRETIELDPIKILHLAIQNVTPVMELQKMKRGGVTYQVLLFFFSQIYLHFACCVLQRVKSVQVPVPILEKRQKFLAMNWLIKSAWEKEREMYFTESLSLILIDAAQNQVSEDQIIFSFSLGA